MWNHAENPLGGVTVLDGTLAASTTLVDSVLAPAEADGDWRVLSPCGSWSASPELVFPTPAVDVVDVFAAPSAAPVAGRAPTDLDWYPVPRD
ncbi:hypothetical protein C8E99_1527 [Citricoccus muralis]|uniref:Uncharacterized protein n=1 Tax=Citricoccus muralis TaxID=169134 RepID=A0A3D9LBG0_9MICC|nr:hypothetical protein C8E99_1527 [Citricoccus muralis]